MPLPVCQNIGIEGIRSSILLTIITTEPNVLMESIHDRMPVILSPEDYELWLEPDFHGQGKLLEMLKPYPVEEMEAFPVSTVVNNPRNEKMECVKAVG